MEIQTYGKFVKEQKVRRYFAVCCFYRDSLFRKAAPEKNPVIQFLGFFRKFQVQGIRQDRHVLEMSPERLNQCGFHEFSRQLINTISRNVEMICKPLVPGEYKSFVNTKDGNGIGRSECLRIIRMGGAPLVGCGAGNKTEYKEGNTYFVKSLKAQLACGVRCLLYLPLYHSTSPLGSTKYTWPMRTPAYTRTGCTTAISSVHVG